MQAVHRGCFRGGNSLHSSPAAQAISHKHGGCCWTCTGMVVLAIRREVVASWTTPSPGPAHQQAPTINIKTQRLITAASTSRPKMSLSAGQLYNGPKASAAWAHRLGGVLSPGSRSPVGTGWVGPRLQGSVKGARQP